VEPVGKVVIGTVKGDLHDIGKNLVGMMMQGAGFEVNDLGDGCRAGQVCGSSQIEWREAGGDVGFADHHHGQHAGDHRGFQAGGIRGEVKILVGGAPVTDQYARQIGADGYASDASQAARLALSLVA
jgi:5-methyltetrahydrofolate--homocysteine methyltransferase